MRVGIRNLPYQLGLANSGNVVIFKAIPTLLWRKRTYSEIWLPGRT